VKKLNSKTFELIKTLLCADGCSAEEAEAFVRTARHPITRPRMGTVHQAAEILQVHPRTLARYARRGLLHAVKYSCRRVRFDLGEVERFAQEGGCHE